ncbi:MAG: ribbon-helix-helix domain-containing protein [Sphingomicrobium sp.]
MRFGVPTKRSVTIAGHETSISLEPAFWAALEGAAAKRELPLNALIAAIDAERLDSEPPPNLTSALRQWLFARGGGADGRGESRAFVGCVVKE